MNQEIISVLMPAYNVEKWIALSIESVLSQTLKEFELIVVDDGSTDGTAKIAGDLSKKDNRIKVYTLKKNLGIVGALNIGLQLSRGIYIARMDSDDIATPDRLEKQLNFLIDHPDYALVGAQMLSIDELGRQHDISPCPVTHQEAKKVLPYSSPVPHIWMCRADVYSKLGGYRQLAPAEDYDFLLRLETMGFKYGNHPDVLMMIRFREGNTASTASLKQRKTHAYVYKLFKKRKNKSLIDSFSDKDFDNHVRASQLMKLAHDFSSAYLSKAIHSQGFRKLFFLIISALSSPYNARYIFNRVLYRILLANRKKESEIF